MIDTNKHEVTKKTLNVMIVIRMSTLAEEADTLSRAAESQMTARILGSTLRHLSEPCEARIVAH